MSQKRKQTGHILFLSGEPNSKGHIYRVLNRIEALEGTGWTVEIFTDPLSINPQDLEKADLLWVFRKTYDEGLATLYSKAKAAICPILFDIDDLIFDPQRSGPDTIRYLETLDETRRTAWQARIPAYRAALERSDFCCFPTQTLADEAADLGSHPLVLRNGLNKAQVAAANSLVVRQPKNGVTIGYASGSPSHHHDFLEAVFPLAEVLAQRRSVQFQKTGHLDLSLYPVLTDFCDQVIERVGVPYKQLPQVLSEYDINLAPLERNNPFSDGKSELKFFETAILECPTIATHTQPFSQAIRHGDTGFLAHDSRDWYNAMMTMIDEPETRKKMGQSARRSALAMFGPAQQKTDLLKLLSHVTGYDA